MNFSFSENDTITLPEEVFLYAGTVSGKEKITIGLTGKGRHLTITNNADRKVFNIHITPEGKTPAAGVEYLLEMRYFTFLRLCKKIEPIFIQLVRQYFLSTTINVGKLKKYGLFCVSQEFHPDLAQALYIIKNKRIRSRKLVQCSVVFDLIKTPDDIWADAAPAYLLFGANRRRPRFQGLLFRDGSSPSRRRYFFVSKKRYNEFCTTYLSCLYNTFQELDFRYKEKFFEFLGGEIFNRIQYRFLQEEKAPRLASSLSEGERI